jgi:hypothetical protein
MVFLATVCFSASIATAEPLERTQRPRKEPAYRTKAPQYGVLVFGPDGKDRVWLVWDGDVLYVDRNGNGDLTEPGKRVVAEKKPNGDVEEDGYPFPVGDITSGGRNHKGLVVYFAPLASLAAGSLGKRADVRGLLAKNPKTMVAGLRADVDVPGLKGAGVGGRAFFMVGPVDLTGVFQFSSTPEQAPHVWLGGPLEITFWESLPTLRVGRTSEMSYVVGTAGIGPGTFAMLAYDQTVPEAAKPAIEIAFPAIKTGAEPIQQKYEIQGRC